ncbi:MAG: hypothetical protein IJC89_05510 [Clostridia bacterium]|nr:hypothetical protein [Clostridia bacterium]
MRLYINRAADVNEAIAKGVVEGFDLEKQILSEADEITWELNHTYFPINDFKSFISALEETKKNNSSLYWGYYKLVNKIKD